MEDDRLRGFLLGALTDTDRDDIEERLLVDDHLYQLLIAAEEELLHEWAHGSLGPQEARSFLGYLEKLPDGRARIDFALHLGTWTAQRRKEDESSPEPRGAGAPGERLRAFRAAWLGARPAAWMTAASFLFAVSAGFLFWAWFSPSRDPGVEPGPPPLSGPVPSVILTPGMTRGGGTLPVVAISPSEPAQELQLDVGVDAFERYHAVLHDADARELFAASRMQPEVTSERTLVVFMVPTERLPPGDYFVSLYGMGDSGRLEPLNRYDFRALGR